MSSLGRRLGAAVVPAVLLLTLSACSDDDGDSSDKDDKAAAGLLTASDMPFEDPQEGSLKKPDPLTQLSTSCVGIEQSVLYDADWTVEARKFYDDNEWSVTTAVFTPPSGSSDDALEQVRTTSEQCIADEPDATVKPLDLGDGTYAFEVQDAQGGFDSARAYVTLDNGTLAQVSVQEMPSSEDATAVLKDLVDETD